MDSQEGPFALGWHTAGSHPEFWGEDGLHATYTLIPYGDLPDLDRSRLDGSFAWLPALPEDDTALGFEDTSVSPADKVARLAQEAADRGVSFPASFVSFLTSPEIHARLPTCTACYLDLADKIIGAPGDADGFLLRFMNDQQCCLLWYLYLRPGGEHGVVVATPEWDEETKGETLEDMVRLTEPLLCAPTFEDFVFRFWLENIIWFSLHSARRLTEEQTKYLNSVRMAKERRRPAQ